MNRDPETLEGYAVNRLVRLERENTTLRANFELVKRDNREQAEKLARWMPDGGDEEVAVAYSERMYMTPQQAAALRNWLQDQGVAWFENEGTVGELGDAE